MQACMHTHTHTCTHTRTHTRTHTHTHARTHTHAHTHTHTHLHTHTTAHTHTNTTIQTKYFQLGGQQNCACNQNIAKKYVQHATVLQTLVDAIKITEIKMLKS